MFNDLYSEFTKGDFKATNDYSDDEIKQRVHEALSKGFNKFKMKVGENVQADIKRCNYFRSLIGWDNILMVDANQRWDVQQAIEWMIQLKDSKPLWIEEPTSPDDILGHLKISQALNKYGIRVARFGLVCIEILKQMYSYFILLVVSIVKIE